MKKIIIPLIGLVVWIWATLSFAAKDLEIKGKQLISQKPPFTLTLPSEFRLIHSFSHENPGENSLTRVYFLIKKRINKWRKCLSFKLETEPILKPNPSVRRP